MRKIAGNLESAPGVKGQLLLLFACYYVRARVYFSEDIHFPSPLHTRLFLAYAWEAHQPPILKKVNGAP